MTFRVGQRVRRIAVVSVEVPIGSTGTVTGAPYIELGEWCVSVEWDGRSDLGLNAPWYTRTLAPLTPPAETEWAERRVRELFAPKLLPIDDLESVRSVG